MRSQGCESEEQNVCGLMNGIVAIRRSRKLIRLLAKLGAEQIPILKEPCGVRPFRRCLPSFFQAFDEFCDPSILAPAGTGGKMAKA